MRVRSRITINHPIEKVFALTANLDQSRGWEAHPEKEERVTYHVLGLPIHAIQQLPGLVTIQRTSAGPLGVGTTFVQITTLRGISTEDLIEITEYEPPRVVTFTQANPVRGEIRWVFNAVEGGTKVTVTVHAETFWLVGLCIAPSAKKALAKQLTRVKEQLEAS